MTQPRLIRPNATYAICRRIQDRRFLLRPAPIFNALFVWALAVTARECRIDVHVATVMSTHFHLVVTAPYEHVSRFMQLLDARLANALKVLRRLPRGVVWAPGELSILELETPEAVVEQLAYAIVSLYPSTLSAREH
jgi:REP element-mobilizing transposase RayT